MLNVNANTRKAALAAIFKGTECKIPLAYLSLLVTDS